GRRRAPRRHPSDGRVDPLAERRPAARRSAPRSDAHGHRHRRAAALQVGLPHGTVAHNVRTPTRPSRARLSEGSGVARRRPPGPPNHAGARARRGRAIRSDDSRRSAMSRLDDRLRAVDALRGSAATIQESPPPRLGEARWRWRPVLGAPLMGTLAVATLVAITVAGHAQLHPPATAASADSAAADVTRSAPSAADRIAQAREAAALGLRERARSLLEQALALTPDDADAWNDLGVVLVLGGDVAAGTRALQRALQLNPRHAGAQENLNVLARQRKPEETK